jgi:hypothetical protein
MPEDDDHISTISRIDCEDPWFAWIFKNIDYVEWSQPNSFQTFWLSGPHQCRLDEVSSYILHREKEGAQSMNRLVLYFFSSSTNSHATAFVRTLLRQIICFAPPNRTLMTMQTFLYALASKQMEQGAAKWENKGLAKGDAVVEYIKEVLYAPMEDPQLNDNPIDNLPVIDLLPALEGVLTKDQRPLSIIIDGLDKFGSESSEFTKAIRIFAEHVQENNPRTRIWLTTRSPAESRDSSKKITFIEYDKERKGSFISDIMIQ